ncbi:MAG: nucleoside recognition domain-containing protein [Chthoniobacterales bacterium]
MLNFIWLGLLLIAVILGGLTGSLDAVTIAAFDACKNAVLNLALPLIGLMALWLGMMRLAERAGLIQLLARALRPLMTRLFPDVPPEHPAMGAMLLNMGANMLGLGNAATPMGLKAMGHLERLNKTPGTASNAMCTFLAINTSSIQLIPATTVAYLAAAKSADPTWIIGPAFLATVCAATSGIIAVKLLEKLPVFRNRAATVGISDSIETPLTEETPAAPSPLVSWAWLPLAVYFGLFAWFAWMLIGHAQTIDLKSTVLAVVRAISTLAVPFLFSFFPLYAALRRIPVYEEFIEGAKEGFAVATRIIPYLVAILSSIGMVRAAFAASAHLDWFAHGMGALSRFLAFIGVPGDLLPLILLRPLSGSGASGVFNEIIRNPALGGPDSLISRMAGCIMGSTETTFYVIAVYFGSVAIRRTRHAIPAGLIADLTGVIASITICRLMFS